MQLFAQKFLVLRFDFPVGVLETFLCFVKLYNLIARKKVKC